MKNRRIGCVAFLVVIAALANSPSTAAPPTSAELANNPGLFLESARKTLKWDEPAEPARLLGPIYFVGTKGLSVFLITTSAGHIVLNTGMPGSGEMIEASIRKLGFKPEDIKILLTAHAHIDHVGGHAYLKKLSGAKVAMIAAEKELIESGGKLDFHYGKEKEFQFDSVNVDTVFKDGDQIKLGDVAIIALLTAGHTKGSTTFLMKVVDEGKNYSVVFPNGTSVNPGYRVEKNPSYPGIGGDYRRTLRTLQEIRPDVWLMPHNEAYDFDAKLARSKTEGAKAWVDPAGYAGWVALQQQKFTDAVATEQRD